MEIKKFKELMFLAADMNEDELSILVLQAEKLMGEGRKEHGPLDVSKDRDYKGEAFDELVDTVNYCLMELLKSRRTQERQYREDIYTPPVEKWSKLFRPMLTFSDLGETTAQCAYCTADVPVCDCLANGDE